MRFLPKDAPRREWGSGSITLRAEKDKKGKAVPVKVADFRGEFAPWFKWLYRSPNGGSKVFLATTRQHAEDLARDWEKTRHEVTQRGTFAEVASDFLRWKERQGSAGRKTITWYGERLDQHILPALGSKQANEITPTDISSLLDQKTDLGPRTTNAIVTLLTGIFGFALDHERVTRNPVRPKLHRRSEKDAVRLRHVALQQAMPTREQVEAFISAALAREDGTSCGAALALAIETGLRREELLHLRREDVTLSGDLADLHVATDFACTCSGCLRNGGQFQTKNRHARYVPLSKRAEKIIRQQLALLDRDAVPGPWLFPVLRHAPYARKGAGSQIHRQQLGAVMEELAKAASIALPDQIQVHFTRHVALSRWEAAGLTQDQRNLASGHEAAGVQAKYSHGDRVGLFQAFRGAGV